MHINRFYQKRASKRVRYANSEVQTTTHMQHNVVDDTKELTELRKIVEMRESYERAQIARHQWEDEQLEEDHAILQLVNEMEYNDGIEIKELGYLSDIRVFLGKNIKEREVMIEEEQESYRKKTIECDEKESELRKAILNKQKGDH